ncbi:hypothetical protein A3F05_01225 [Candidatus Saccharibacteria bacterium RIFCSPHIGHO2_12_FULL_47_17]|nr:MAG: hypothetical protein A3F05_01225 [Candidatus Saccharibacteria bacterium RIFCSPHIGHO2_12_FULL_47_17]
MLDFLLVLGQIPGTNIQLNFIQICLIALSAIWLLYHKHYRTVWVKVRSVTKKHMLVDSLRALVIWTYLTIQKLPPIQKFTP